MYKALVIGCGNIGAGYDFNNDQVLTHAKALSLNNNFSFAVFDTDKELVSKVNKRYECDVVDEVNPEIIKNYDCVSICSPTKTHYRYLNDCIDAKVKVVLCEKPVSSNADELPELQSKYTSGSSKILVNYTRRFQLRYIELKEIIKSALSEEKLSNVSIRYQRGFINNCSHAFDLLEFLTGRKLELTDIKKSNSVNDHFENDPTLSITANWNEINLNVLGLSNVLFPYFDIDLYFESTKIEIKELGRTIEIFKSDDKNSPLTSRKIFRDCMKDNMIHVLARAEELLKNPAAADNFTDAVELNQRMLNYLNN